MDLIIKLGTRKNNGHFKQSWGLFLCPYCKKNVEKQLGHGKQYKSCGCDANAHKISHGESRTKLYRVWDSMKSRCLNSKHHAYKDYGGRGITLCHEWYEYEPFKKWALEHGYVQGLTIDRIDNNNGYSELNCRFINIAENLRNRRSCKLNWLDVVDIRNKYNSGKFRQTDLANEYNVVRPLISLMVNNKRWNNEVNN